MSRRRVWGVALGIATLLAVLFPTQNYMGRRASRMLAQQVGSPVPPEIPWTTLFLGELPVWYSWLLVTPLVFWVSRRFPLVGSRLWVSLPVHLVAGLTFITVVLTATTVVQQLVLGSASVELSFLEAVWLAFLSYFAYFLIIYAAIVTVYHAVEYYGAFQRRALHASQLEARLAHAQLSVLKMQLQPHFLFNTLNSIASLMFKDLAAAQRTIVLLSDLLRMSLENAASHEVPLRDEVAFLDRYVEIQRIRFRNRLRVEYAIDPGTEKLLVPRLILQPLVENAIRHGVERRVGEGRVEVISAMRDGRVLLEVRDNGPGFVAGNRGEAMGGGIGLRNTRLRLQQLYGADHSFALENLEPSGLAVRIEVPQREPASQPAQEVHR